MHLLAKLLRGVSGDNMLQHSTNCLLYSCTGLGPRHTNVNISLHKIISLIHKKTQIMSKYYLALVSHKWTFKNLIDP